MQKVPFGSIFLSFISKLIIAVCLLLYGIKEGDIIAGSISLFIIFWAGWTTKAGLVINDFIDYMNEAEETIQK